MKPPLPSNRAFGIAVGTVLSLITLIGHLLFKNDLLWIASLAIVFFLLAWLSPMLLMPFNRIWGWFALQLGRINNALLLGLILYGVLTPIGLLLRLLKHDALKQQLDTNATTYLTPVYRQTNEETSQDLF